MANVCVVVVVGFPDDDAVSILGANHAILFFAEHFERDPRTFLAYEMVFAQGDHGVADACVAVGHAVALSPDVAHDGQWVVDFGRADEATQGHKQHWVTVQGGVWDLVDAVVVRF